MSATWKPLDFAREISDEIDLNLPGIYEWRIDGRGSYIGQSRRLKRRFPEYPNNVRKLAIGQPYRANKPDRFRTIHHEMYLAYSEQRAITLIVLENCPLEQLNERKQFWIAQRGSLNR